jgi:hypothetical protein
MRILGLDPGTAHFAYSIAEMRGNRLKVLKHGMFHTTIKQLKDSQQYREQRKQFQDGMLSLYQQYQFSLIIAERYMPRGQFAGMGNAQELIPMMLAALECMELAPILFISAAAWKNEVKRNNLDLKELYLHYKGAITPHQIDATHMAIYGLHRYAKLPYDFTRVPQMLDKAKGEDVGERVRVTRRPRRKSKRVQ